MTNPLLSLIRDGRPVIVPGVYDGITTRIADTLGFSALYLTGAGVSVGRLGIPDVGLISRGDVFEALSTVTGVSQRPVIVDADTGFGSGIQVTRTAAQLFGAGAAAIQLEDQVERKRCGHLEGKKLVPPEEFVERLRAAQQGRGAGEGLIIARTDGIAVEGFAATLDRVQTYAENGADLIFVEAPETIEQIREIPAEVDKPVVFNWVESGNTPRVSLSALAEWGYALVIVPGVALRPAVLAAEQALRGLKEQGEIDSGFCGSPQSLFDLAGLQQWQDFEAELGI